MREELSPSEAARRIGATTRTVQRWISLGRLPARRIGGRWRVASDALDAFTLGSGDQIGSPHGAAIHHVFVANRGEIARRISRTCDQLGIRVTVASNSGTNPLDLLDIEAVTLAACAAGSDALHPGFGFLAENADFASAVEAAGLRWVGPPPAAIRAMGDKGAARRLAQSLGIAIVPGYDGADQSDSALTAAASEIGFPLLLKPAAGGGGKGMRTVRDPAPLPDAIASARREAMSSFGDDRLILERLIEGPRHVEVQVLFDAHGHGIHLGERDCSIQRRHQKVLEETPSPAVARDMRERITDAALRLAATVGYASAGTCEFLLTDRGEIFFLEMNTRLQVEHPVTELVTGRDLVADQLMIAAGEPLDVTQAEIDAALVAGGHAVEVRLYAEDAEDGFLPATGRVERLRWPAGDGIRVDAGIDEGDEITDRFDPMLAKIVAHGRDRTEALDRLTTALDQTVVLGLITNLRFLRWLVREPAVRDGQARIDTLDRIWPPDDWQARAKVPDTAWLAAAWGLEADGWRLNAARRVRLAADGGTERLVELRASHTSAAEVVTSSQPGNRTAFVDVGGRSVAFRLALPPDVDRAARAAAAQGAGGAGGPVDVVAPMPGNVLAVHVAAGTRVVVGDPILTLEAMKMEHVVVAPIAGTVAETLVRPADQVARGQALAIIEP